MEIIKKVDEMQKRSDEIRHSGQIIAFVPTMGFLHEGHLKLMEIGKNRSDKLIISIFVNPLQFGPNEDFDAYPRDMEGDLAKAEGIGTDIVFLPSVKEMYRGETLTTVSVARITEHLCGLSRPEHFTGVTTVVNKLFNITKPHLAIFGEKDFQQLAVIKRMVKDLDLDIEILGVPTVRESDGLAMSSRNNYLTPDQRVSALCLWKSLELARNMFSKGERNATVIITAIKKMILEHSFTEIDYVSICDPVTLEDITRIDNECLLALAVRVGKTRLIDNVMIGKQKASAS